MLKKILMLFMSENAKNYAGLFYRWLAAPPVEVPNNSWWYLSGQAPMVERRSSSVVRSPGMLFQQPCAWSGITASSVPSLSACHSNID